MDKIKLTVFTPAYNRAHTLPRTYESLCKQTNKNFIWMIVDDGSTDHSLEILKEYQDYIVKPSIMHCFASKSPRERESNSRLPAKALGAGSVGAIR